LENPAQRVRGGKHGSVSDMDIIQKLQIHSD
jgi:hypothetical protein